MAGTEVTFKPEIDGPSIPMYTVMSGKNLRNLYISRKYGTQIKDWVQAGVDPACKTEQEMQTLVNTWTTEAEIKYSGEGDYRVRLLDESSNSIPIGSSVTFIVEEDQVVSLCEESVPLCSNRVIVFQICNSNALIDDNFDIYLNGLYVGSVDLNSASLVGSVFIGSLNPNLVITSSDFICPLVGMTVYRFDPALLKANNIIKMKNTQNNGNGNIGSVGIRNYLLTGNNLSAPCVIDNLTFSPSVGQDATLSFEYTECCP